MSQTFRAITFRVDPVMVQAFFGREFGSVIGSKPEESLFLVQQSCLTVIFCSELGKRHVTFYAL